MSTYRSTGTIRVRSEPKKPTKIFFTPNGDSTVCNRGKQYAIFIGGNNFRDCLWRGIRDSGGGVSITVPSDFPGLVEAAARQTLVEIEVNCNWTLRAITIPAPGKK